MAELNYCNPRMPKRMNTKDKKIVTFRSSGNDDIRALTSLLILFMVLIDFKGLNTLTVLRDFRFRPDAKYSITLKQVSK